MGPPIEIIIQLKEVYNIPIFVETGTYYGETAYWASKVFEKVITIEYSSKIYKTVTEKYGGIKNIEFMFGDSRSMLVDIADKLDTSAIFWLDAHWSGGATYGEIDQCPLIKEIEIINNTGGEHFIFIDDARGFLSPPPLPNSIDIGPNITDSSFAS
jgi:hypothetical protein